MTRVFSLCLAALMWCGIAADAATFTLACSPRNDLFLTMKACGLKPKRCDTPTQAISAAAAGSAVLLLADDYPNRTAAVSEELYRKAGEKKIRLYIEYPSMVPGLNFGAPQKAGWERFIIDHAVLGGELAKGQLLMAHECQFLPTTATDPVVVVGRVAGYDTAIYGIPKSTQPILFEIDNGRVMVATTKLSSFITGRFAPTREWEQLWDYILASLAGDDSVKIKWQPRIQPWYGPDERLPAGVERKTLSRAVDWIFNSGLLISEAREPAIQEMLKSGLELTEPPANPHGGDGRFGILEGFNSAIRTDGSQLQRVPVRADCQAETAMVLAMNWALNHKSTSRKTATNLLDFLYFNSDICRGDRGNPKHPGFGLIAWGSTAPAWLAANYGDDNARTLLATILSETCLHSGRWDESVLRGVMANLRTAGKFGFRGDRVDMPGLSQRGWRAFHDAATVNYAPHFEAYLWACYLWAYAHTGEPEFLEKAKTAIGMTMAATPEKWRWNDNMERAHMLLCLSWLDRIEDTEEHRQWLRNVADDLIRLQVSCGAIPEHFRGMSGSHYQIPQSNEAYGTTETPLLQENGDPVSDQLYVTGFVLLGLHEAAVALHEPRLTAAEDKLAEYACRIQIRSSTLPALNGTWFRAFDFKRWEPWASSADAGWGAWSEEAGWAQSWTAAVIGLRQMKTNFWDFTASTAIAEQLPHVRAQMAENSGGPWR